MEKAGHERWDIRRFATGALGAIGDKEAVDKLTEMVRSDENAVASAAVYGLQDVAVAGKERTLALRRLQDLLSARAEISDDVGKLLKDVNRRFSSKQRAAAVPVIPFSRVHEQVSRMIDAKKYDAALDTLRPYADGGNLVAQYITATVYLHRASQRDTEDISSAVLWFEKAAKAGYAPAAYELGLMYVHGRGVVQDPTKGVQLLKAAETAGYGPARQELENSRPQGLGGLSAE